MNNFFDIMIYESGSGGDLNLRNNDLETIKGLTNQAYLALFGGNIEQSTSDDLDELEFREDWWGNEYLDDEFQFNSSFERSLLNNPLTVNGVSKMVDAANADLEYLREYAEINVFGSILDVNRMLLEIEIIEPDGLSAKIKLLWDRTRQEFIEQKII